MTEAKKPHVQRAVSERVYPSAQQNKSDPEQELLSSTNRFEGVWRERGFSCRLLRRPEVEACTGLSRSTLYHWMRRGKFPQPVRLGERLVAWRESDIAAWMEARETRVP